MGKTTIEWAEHTVNPIRARNVATGAVGHFCEKVSPGCSNCYASDWNERVRPTPNGKLIGTGLKFLPVNRDKVVIFLDREKLQEVLRRKKPTAYFWCDMTDLFGEWVPDEFIDTCFAVMALTPHHTHMVLTKRAKRMRDYMNGGWGFRVANLLLPAAIGHVGAEVQVVGMAHRLGVLHQPLPNVRLGVSAENQHWLDERLPELLATPAAVRFVSVEPLLGGLDVAKHRPGANRLWFIVGGMSGRGAQPCWVPHVRSVVRQCQDADARVFVKQLGANIHDRNDAGFEGDTPRSWPMDTDTDDRSNGYRFDFQGDPVRVRLRDRKGGDMAEWPEDLRVREMPGAAVPA